MESQTGVQDLSGTGVEPAHQAKETACAFSTKTTEGASRYQPGLVYGFHA